MFVVETLLASSVFVDGLDVDGQQHESFKVGANLPAHWTMTEMDEDIAMPDESHAFVHEYPVTESSYLISAISSADIKGVRLLVNEQYVDVDVRGEHGATALMTCVTRNLRTTMWRPNNVNTEMVQCLLDHNADARLMDAYGWTVLHHAIERRDGKVVDLLLDHITKMYGIETIHSDLTALELAHAQRDEYGASHVLSSLFKHGACVQAHDRLLARRSTLTVTERRSCALC